MKLSVYQESLLKKISSVERRKSYRSEMKARVKLINQNERVLECMPDGEAKENFTTYINRLKRTLNRLESNLKEDPNGINI